MAVVLKAIGLLIRWMPLVIKVVKEIEVLLSDKPGDEKRDAAIRLIKEAFVARGIAWTEETQKIVRGILEFAVGLLDMVKGWRKPQVAAKLSREGRLPQ